MNNLSVISDSAINCYIILAFLMFINTSIGFPPSELICITYGALASTNKLNLILVIAIASIFNLLGTSVLFFIAKKYEKESILAFFNRLHKSRIRQIAAFCGFGILTISKVNKAFEDHGELIVFLGRNIPLVRSIISFPAGMAGMGWVKFCVLSFFGIAIWVTEWCIAGYFVGQGPSNILNYMKSIGVVSFVLFILWMIWILSKIKNEKTTDVAKETNPT